MYKFNKVGITRLSDGACIPADSANTDYQKALQWQADGNTIAPADPDPVDIQNALVIADIQATELSSLRAIREFILGDQSAKARLKAIDDSIAAKRTKLKS